MTLDDYLLMDDEGGALCTQADFEWAICDRCEGDGVLGGYPGVYTQDDFAEDPDFAEDYFNHRRRCEDCDGAGKVRQLRESAASRPEVASAILDYFETERIYAMERRMGA